MDKSIIKHYVVLFMLGALCLLFWDVYQLFEYLYVPKEYYRDMRRACWFILVIHALLYAILNKNIGKDSILNICIPTIVLLFGLPSEFARKYYINLLELYRKHNVITQDVYFSYYAKQSLKYFILPKIAWFAVVFHLLFYKMKLYNPILASKIENFEKTFIHYVKKFLYIMFMIVVCCPIIVGVVLMTKSFIEYFIR